MSVQDDDKAFLDPNLAINRVYTRHGDKGMTRLVGGQKIAKYDLRIDSYGTVDELNAFVGIARQTIREHHGDQEAFGELDAVLLRVQHELFNLGSILATLPEDIGPKMPRVTEVDVRALEESIDAYNEDCPPLRSFVLPGGTRLNADLHVCRTVCRRAERLAVELGDGLELDPNAVSYLNRLSDAFFVWSRWAVIRADVEEVLWSPNLGASGKA